MSISNANVDFHQTDANYHLVKAMGEKIRMMSWGLDLLDESTMFLEMSVMMREQGSLEPAYKWAQKALEVRKICVKIVCIALVCCIIYTEQSGELVREIGGKLVREIVYCLHCL